jgi:hypothetical protein
MQALLILLAPIFFAASICMFLSRIINATGCVALSTIGPARLIKVFNWRRRPLLPRAGLGPKLSLQISKARGGKT